MNSLRSPAIFRTILCDTSAEMRAINSTTLPDGATLFNNENKSLYRLDKDAGTTFDSLIPTLAVIKPDDGTAARWLADTVAGATPYYYEAYLSGGATVTIAGSNTWALLGNQVATFLKANGTIAYTLNATTGLLTYNGPPVLALVRAAVSLSNASGATSINASVVISHNNDVPSGDTGAKQSRGMQQGDVSSDQASLTTQRIVLLSPGSTLQLALRNGVNGDDFLIADYQIVILPL
jgi:hypothetical protein